MRRRAQAFTLIELLAATALFAVLSVLLFQTARSAMEVWTDGERDRDLAERARAAFALLGLDLRHAWAGAAGAGEQEARLLVQSRPLDVDGDGTPDQDAAVLSFTRLCFEQRSLPELRAAGSVAGAQALFDGTRPEEPLRATGGLAESLYALALLPGEASPSLVRRVRAPVGGEGSLVDPELLLRPELLLAGAVPVAERVLDFRVLAWGPDTTGWDEGAYEAWDSTRGLLPDFPHGAGAASLLDGSDDLVPALLRLELVLEGGLPQGTLAEAASAEASRLTLSSTGFLAEAGQPAAVRVDGEWVELLAVEGRQIVVRRGARGGTARPHDRGAPVLVGRSFTSIVALPAVREGHGR